MLALNHIHFHDIVHRDIKPDNVMISDDLTVKILDFGLANVCHETEDLTTVIGTPYYVAPEVLRGHYSEECDMWSVGVVLYILLSSRLPFMGDTPEALLTKVAKGEYEMDPAVWDPVCDDAKDLVRNLLQVNPEERLTAADALKHPWFAEISDQGKLDPKVIESLLAYRSVSKLKQQALEILISTLPKTETDYLVTQFHILDGNGVGCINADKLKAGAQSIGIELGEAEVASVMNEMCDGES